MKKMTVRKMLERIVVATNKRRAKNIVLVSTDGEIVEAEFAVDLIRTLTDWNILWEVSRFPGRRRVSYLNFFMNFCNLVLTFSGVFPQLRIRLLRCPDRRYMHR